MKKRIIIPIVILVISSLLAACASLKPPKPQIRQAEFPYTLTYEIDGEEKTAEGTIQCEFDGYEQPTSAGWYRKWKVSLTNGDNVSEDDSAPITLLDLRGKGVYDDLGNEVTKLYFFGGNGHYYMGDDLEHLDRAAQNFDEICYAYKTGDGKIGHSAYPADKAYELFGIRLTGWEAAEPVENTF